MKTIETQLYTVKTIPPQTRGSLHRERLMALLDAGAGIPLTWISGPPGSGKTTLISDYLKQLALPCLWYRLDQEDRLLASFWRFFSGAWQRLIHPHQVQPLHYMPERHPQFVSFVRQYFENSFSHLPARTHIVLDNYHFVDHLPDVNELLNWWVVNRPPDMYLFVISRRPPSEVFTRMTIEKRLRHISWEALRFTREETVTFLQTRSPPNKSGSETSTKQPMDRYTPEQINEICDQTQGWITGMVLMADLTKTDSDTQFKVTPNRKRPEYRLMEPKSAPRAFLDDPERFQAIFNYFAVEVIQTLAPNLRSFLLKTAFLPAMTVSMAETLSGDSRAADYLETLCHSHQFTTYLPGNPARYQYHPLFRDFLMLQAARYLEQKVLTRLKRQTARLLAENGDMLNSAVLWAQIKDWKRLKVWLHQWAPQLIEQDNTPLLFRIIRILPLKQIHSDPWLLFWFGICQQPINPSESIHLFEQAYNAFKQRDDQQGLLSAWCVIIETVLLAWKDFTILDVWIDRMNAWLEAHSRFPDIHTEANVTAAMAAALLWRRPLNENVQYWLERAQTIFSQTNNFSQYFMNALNVFYYYYWTGKTTAAQLLLEELQAELRCHPDRHFEAFLFRIQHALVDAWSGENIGRASSLIDECVAMARTHGFLTWRPVMLSTGVYAALSAGNLVKADELLNQMREVADARQSHFGAHYHFVAAWRMLLQKNYAKALAHARQNMDISLKTGAPFPEALIRLAFATILFAAGLAEEGDVELNQALNMAIALKSDYFQFSCHLLAAEFGRDANSRLEALRQALLIGRRENYLNTIWGWDPERMARLCQTALAHEIETAYVQKLIRKRSLVPDQTLGHNGHWPWPIRIYCLGCFALMREEHRLDMGTKARKKPLMLLKAHIALGCREVPLSRLADLLWPDTDGDAAAGALKFTLHTLRQILGIKNALHLQQGRLTLDERYVWVDAQAFEVLTDQVLGQWHQHQQDDHASEMAEEAMDLYRGDFLALDDSSFWLLTRRERLKSKLIRLVDGLGRYYEFRQQWEKAIRCYLRALDVHHLQEMFYRSIMRCHLCQGQQAEALAIYERCRTLLKAGLDIEPAQETQKLVAHLLHP